MGPETAMAVEAAPAREDLLAGYQPLPGIYDEMMDEAGKVRPHWAPFIDRLAAEPVSGLTQRFDAADRYLKESGVFYRVYDDPAATERPWPLSHMPLLISPSDWATIKAGVIQRAGLIEALLADIYSGGARLAQLGVPAALIAGSPDYLRPLVQHGRPSRRQLHLYAVDLGRGPDGTWWVLRDRTQAPSGAGYALENRIALSRALSDIFRSFDVERHAPYFDAVRAELARYQEPGDAGVCLLTPGPLNETYFEHSYLARYLGFRLVEGTDLMVLGSEVYLRTVAGLRKVRVLLRRIDGDFADPLELNSRSKLGVAGLARAARRGSVTLANGLGSGVVEGRGMLGFIPALAEPLIGEELLLPNVATWWCGQEEPREDILATLGDRVIASAFSRVSSGIPPGGPWAVSDMLEAERDVLADSIRRRGVDFVGQQLPKLSTMPVWSDGQLTPQPFTLRVFVSATEDGYTVLPGGFALIGSQEDPTALTMQRGARSADVWALSDGPVAQKSLIPSETQIAVQRGEAVLPSRAADNLFWLARYIERADATLRLIRALAARVSGSRVHEADVTGLTEILFRWGASDALYLGDDAGHAAETALMLPTEDGSVASLIDAARRAGLGIRERFPPDAWRALEDLHAYLHSPFVRAGDDAAVLERASNALRIIAAVTGFQLETMNRVAGWRFLKLGFRIERALATCRFARQFACGKDRSRSELDLLLELNDCQVTYRSRYPIGAARAPVIDLVLLDDSNPRSLAFQLNSLEAHVMQLPLLPPSNRPSPALAVSQRLKSVVSMLDPSAVSADDVLGIENGLMHLSDEISLSYFRVRDPFVAEGGGQ